MLRSGGSRTLARAFVRSSQTPSVPNAPCKLRTATQTRVLSFKPSTVRSPVPYRPATLALVRHAHGGALSPESQKHQDRLKNEFLKATPQAVSTSSTVRDAVEPAPEEDVDMGAGIRSDIKTIKETFTLQEVPREALWVGMAGVVPYLATSLSTVFLAWDMNHAAHTGYGVIFSEKTAEALLHIIEPLQIGYGAVIISFLGAIHWGLEWAKFGGTDFGYKRYWVGVMAPAIAWPTTLMPIEYALITQFLAFNWLYFTDSRAAATGMAPHWYGIYRFVLTFVVGASIVASLIGRGQIVEMVGRPSSALHKIQELQEATEEYLEKEEDIKEEYLAKEEADGDDEGEGEGDSKEEE